MMRINAMKERLYCDLDCVAEKICADKRGVNAHDLETAYRLSKAICYIDKIMDSGKHHHHIHYKGDDIPEHAAGEVHHHVDHKEEVHADTMVKTMI